MKFILLGFIQLQGIVYIFFVENIVFIIISNNLFELVVDKRGIALAFSTQSVSRFCWRLTVNFLSLLLCGTSKRILFIT